MKIEEFINIQDSKLYNQSDYFTICKRENNSKRDFIIVQNYLGKHVPQRPSLILNYFNKLKNEINKNTSQFDLNHTMSISSEDINGIFYFAETATAIGKYLKNNLRINYEFYTTREELKDNKKKLMSITEDHCHAPVHTVVGSTEELKKCKRILIIDDEITSGNTIWKVIENIKIINPKIKIFIASFMNLMDEETIMKFIYNDIQIITLVKGQITEKDKKVNDFDFPNISEIKRDDSILVLGTEEDMYNALIYAYKLEQQKFDVCFHASTRSPIVPIKNLDYSLKTRTDFISAKDLNRSIYLYNLTKYKQIFIFRDKLVSDFDERAEELLKDYSILPIQFYDYTRKENN